MSELLEKQFEFSYLLGLLLEHAHKIGYDVTVGEAWRSPETCEIYAKEGKGVAHSNHINRLAIDLNLFKDGKLLSLPQEYEPLGSYWESLSTPNYKCCWGGNFKKGSGIGNKSRPDAYHFSIEHAGVR